MNSKNANDSGRTHPRRGPIIGLAVALGVLALAGGLYLARGPLFGPVLRNTARDRLEESLGTGGSYEIGPIGGSYLTGLDVSGVKLTLPETGELREVTVDEIHVSYNPLRFLGENPVSGLERIEARGVRVRLAPERAAGTGEAELGAGAPRTEGGTAGPGRESGQAAGREATGTDPGELLRSIIDSIPERLAVLIEGELTLESEDEPHRIPFELSGNTAEQVTLTIETPRELVPWSVPPLVMTRGENSVSIVSRTGETGAETLGAAAVSAGDVPEIRLEVDLTERDGGADISRLRGAFMTDEVSVDLEADTEAVAVRARMTPAGTAQLRELIVRFTGDLPPLGLGSLDLDLAVTVEPGAPAGFIDSFITDPIQAQRFLSGGGTVQAENWTYRDVPVTLLSGELNWRNDVLSVRGFRAESRNILVLTADNLTLDPARNFAPINLEQLEVNVIDLVRFMELLQRGDVPLIEMLDETGAAGATSWLEVPRGGRSGTGPDTGTRTDDRAVAALPAGFAFPDPRIVFPDSRAAVPHSPPAVPNPRRASGRIPTFRPEPVGYGLKAVKYGAAFETAGYFPELAAYGTPSPAVARFASFGYGSDGTAGGPDGGRSGTGGAAAYGRDTRPLMMRVQAREPPFENLPFNVTTGDIALRDGILSIGRFRAVSGESFVLEVGNLELDSRRNFVPVALDAVALSVRDPAAIGRLLLKREIGFLSLFDSLELRAVKDGDALSIEIFTVRGPELEAEADGSFRLRPEGGSPSVSFDLRAFTARIPRLRLAAALSAALDLTDFSGSAVFSRLAAEFSPGRETEEPAVPVAVTLSGAAETAWSTGGVSAAADRLELLGGAVSFSLRTLSAEGSGTDRGDSGEPRGRLEAEFSLESVSLSELRAVISALVSEDAADSIPELAGRVNGEGVYRGPMPGGGGAAPDDQEAAGETPPGTGGEPADPDTSARGSDGSEHEPGLPEVPAPEFSITLRTAELSVDGVPGNFDLVATQEPGVGLRFAELSGGLRDIVSFEGGGLFPVTIGGSSVSLTPLENADFLLTGRAPSLLSLVPEDAREYLPDSTPELRFSVGKTPGRAELFLRAIDSTPPADAFGAGILPFQVLQAQAVVEGLTTGTWNAKVSFMTEQHTLFSGAFTLEPGTTWRLATLVDTALHAPISGKASFYVPLERFADSVPGVQNLTGIVSGTVSAAGSVRSPELTGEITIRDTSLRVQSDIPSLDGLTGRITFENNDFTIESFEGLLGHAPFAIGGFVNLSRRFELRDAGITIRGEDILVIRTPELRVRANTDLRITGEVGRILVQGAVEVTEALYTRNIPLINLSSSAPSVGSGLQFFSVRGDLGRGTDLDIRITADDTIELDTNLYRGTFSLDLSLLGTAAVPLPQGRVFTDSGRVTACRSPRST